MEGVTPATASPWSIVDLLLLIGLGLSVVMGLWRGLVSEVMSLGGWLVSYTAANALGPAVGLHVPVGEAGGRLNVVAGMVCAFVAAWLTWAALSWAVTQLMRESPLSGPDRLLGGGFGLIRGVLVALVVATLVNMTPLARWEPWQASRGVGWLAVLLEGLRPALPEQVVKFLPEQS
ncbi:CvpA family protein [Aquabacterium sp.]|uniref:CvpA family protein n=1 Tax=Aquabacterium sp. TaxID=1872578 RepID=UPI0025B8511B|nr:CvpA family protein [Aquabacterium sp.]